MPHFIDDLLVNSSKTSQINFSFVFSQENFITPAVFGEIIYENFLFDIPKLLDLCVLFGKGNSQLLHKMIGERFVRFFPSL